MAENNNPHSGHRERTWSKFGELGIKAFKEHEILEALLFLMLPRVNTNVTAHRLIDEFGSLKNVLLAPRDELQRVEGIGKTSALQLSFIGALTGYVNRMRTTAAESFSSSRIITEYCIKHFKDKSSENLTLLLLDDKYALLHVHDFSSDMPNHVSVDYREVFGQVIRYDCRKVVIAHNHTAGTADPSDDDLKITREIGKSLKIINVGLVDHIIVRGDTAVSIRNLGILSDVWDL